MSEEKPSLPPPRRWTGDYFRARMLGLIVGAVLTTWALMVSWADVKQWMVWVLGFGLTCLLLFGAAAGRSFLQRRRELAQLKQMISPAYLRERLAAPTFRLLRLLIQSLKSEEPPDYSFVPLIDVTPPPGEGGEAKPALSPQMQDMSVLVETVRNLFKTGLRFYGLGVAFRWGVNAFIATLVAVGGVIGAMILLQQNWLIEKQNGYLRTQLEELQLQNRTLIAQVETERNESQASRRAELYRTLYEEELCREQPEPVEGEEPKTKMCPKADKRSRQEAVKALYEIERNKFMNSENGEFVGLDLQDAHLEEVRIGGGALRRANLNGAHLEGANLDGARLEGASLRGAHLEGASLWGTHLEGACLWETHLDEVNLSGTNLKGVFFREPVFWPVRFTPRASHGLIAFMLNVGTKPYLYYHLSPDGYDYNDDLLLNPDGTPYDPDWTIPDDWDRPPWMTDEYLPPSALSPK